jgi:peptidoglycan/xylan/chitin deacetylase (PgdA/CDA1 family)
VAGASGLCHLLRRGNRAPVFCFHNVLADSGRQGDASLHIPAGDFARYVSWIADTYEVVPVRDIMARLSDGRSVAGLAALTFDDAYRGVVRHAVPVLRQRGLPATLFVVASATEAPDHFWWDVLGGREGFSAADRSRCVHDLAGERGACLEAYGAGRVSGLGPDLLPSTWAELQSASADVDFGVHTVTHRNLTRVAPLDAEAEMAACRSAISDRLGVVPTLVSYPYGAHDAAVAGIASRLGFEGALVLEGRLASPISNRFMMPRINVPSGISPAALECRAVEMQRLKPRRAQG